MSRPRIGITCSPLRGPAYYALYTRAVEAAGGEPVALEARVDGAKHNAGSLIQTVDGLLIPGGWDVDPAAYGEAREQPTDEIDPPLDHTEIALIRAAVGARVPVFGICRGQQVINVALGGTLRQHIDGHDMHGHARDLLAHEVYVAPDSELARAVVGVRLRVNSLHHQSVKDVAPGLRVSAHSPDGVIEGIESPDGMVVAVQCHPEELVDQQVWATSLFQHFVQRVDAQGPRRATRIRGALAAAVTPVSSAVGAVDSEGIASVVDFYARAGLDGLLVLGTTGEGVLLSAEERRVAAERYIESAQGRLPVVVHCGAQSTRDTVTLAEHAAAHEADGVAVISPPYYALDDASILRHLIQAATACAPLPFYVYEFAARSGYAVPVSVILRLRDSVTNLAGIKVSDAPFDRVEPYLIEGLDVFIGSEDLIHDGLQRGAAGAVSGLAAALPELTIDAVRTGSVEASAAAGRVRESIQRFPFHSALKVILQRRGVTISDAVAAPLRCLDAQERHALDALLGDPGGEIAPLLDAPGRT